MNDGMTIPKAKTRPVPHGDEPTVSAIIVNFNGDRLVARAAAAVLDSDVSVEVLVVDNASRDGSLERLERLFRGDSRVRVFRNEENLGFAAANNLAMSRSRGEYILLVNPDCLVGRETVSRVLASMAVRPEVGMAGCLIRNPDGTEQAGCRRAVPTPWRTMVRTLCLNKLFPRHPRFQSFVLGGQPLPAEPVPQEAISGAFMLVRRAALEEVGALDEGYFLHCEDLDWCMRFRQASWQILFVPHAEALHYKGYCSRDRPVFVSWHMHKGMARFYRKFFRHQYPAPLMVGVFGAVWVRFVILAFLYWSRSRFGRTQPDNVPDEETVSTGRIGDTRSVRRRSDPIADNAVRTFALREAARGSHAISRAADDRKSSGARRTKPHGFRT